MRVLHVAAEVFPWVKTGGLGDVLGALPPAQCALGADVRLLVPGYAAVLQAMHAAGEVATVAEAPGSFGALRVRLVRGQLVDTAGTAAARPLTAYAVDAPYHFVRDGGPYLDAHGRAWPDNAQRFALLSWLAAQLAVGAADEAWTPQVVHAHDWHAALACAWLDEVGSTRTASVFTVHNLAYQGVSALHDAPLLNLGARWLTHSGLEFHGQLNMLKAGLAFSDELTTVSPSYAREIATPEFGFGMEGVIASRATPVRGVLNGIDDGLWNPSADRCLAATYSADQLAGKAACREALLAECGLDAVPALSGGTGTAVAIGANRATDAIDAWPAAPVLAVVSRLTSQKGLDLLLGAVAPLLHRQPSAWRLVLQGSGDPALQSAFKRLAAEHPRQVCVFTDFDEERAHRIVAGADLIVVPSRFEPCGLTQMYGLRYGTVPLVRRVGGLADTVADATPAALADGSATGFVFDAATPQALAATLERAVALWQQPAAWQRLMRQGMRQDFSWKQPAQRYLALYEQALRRRGSMDST